MFRKAQWRATTRKIAQKKLLQPAGIALKVTNFEQLHSQLSGVARRCSSISLLDVDQDWWSQVSQYCTVCSAYSHAGQSYQSAQSFADDIVSCLSQETISQLCQCFIQIDCLQRPLCI